MAKRRTINDNPFARTGAGAPEGQGDKTTGRHDDISLQRQDAETTGPVRMAFYLSPDVVAALEERYTANRATARATGEPDMRRVSRSAIVEEALRAYLGI